MSELKTVTSFVITAIRINDDRSIVVLATVTYSDTTTAKVEFTADSLKP